jgi:hypothetical protein
MGSLDWLWLDLRGHGMSNLHGVFMGDDVLHLKGRRVYLREAPLCVAEIESPINFRLPSSQE